MAEIILVELDKFKPDNDSLKPTGPINTWQI